MITLENITKTYGDNTALDAIDLRISPGMTTVILGRSGCGKSTILRTIIGLIEPDIGSVYIDGHILNPSNVYRLRQSMGYVIQEGGLFPHLTTERNISLMARHLGRDSGWIERRIAELCELTKFPIEGLLRYPIQLSGGQRQRVSLMRALMLEPDILLLDEPLGALDPLIRYQLQVDLKSVFGTLNKTVVMVTHDLGEAGFLGDTMVLMEDGSIVQQGTLTELARTPAEPFVTEFINAQRNPLDVIGGDQD
ncbi:MAG: ATP-binding cassette domain-containing protein [Candidatus Dadabacteria bacterium]|nr:ATP-binding cassette domain-containing protein [Candidatus Dadabacteria bacterium]